MRPALHAASASPAWRAASSGAAEAKGGGAGTQGAYEGSVSVKLSLGLRVHREQACSGDPAESPCSHNESRCDSRCVDPPARLPAHDPHTCSQAACVWMSLWLSARSTALRSPGTAAAGRDRRSGPLGDLLVVVVVVSGANSRQQRRQRHAGRGAAATTAAQLFGGFESEAVCAHYSSHC